MKLVYLIGFTIVMMLFSCHSEPSLQRYFVDNLENKDFVSLDVSSNIINIDKAKLTSEEKDALESFEKMNILLFKMDSAKTKTKQFEIESAKVKQILKGKEYQELMKVGSGTNAASISFVGDEDKIDEFVIYAKGKDTGFAIVRILGDDMNPNNVMSILSIIKNSGIDMEQLKPLEGLMK
ncbi:MAG TPA: DUF4252 domain-containing protein [Flavobacterium sp.]|jgi:hypothetical protein|uniref:DUF4252 domain-containing protein n=1 Tax=Flavobacterium sp. TaxID=239 RepID=UPI002B81FD4C|nr:DUF4252 domain-containing protein [Flavobacterium sp.]MCA0348060.1 DUF4252 domain-containing protein [Bacteroidota bacterium]HPW97365.1 DUF4252 domain-containing protein [Flavobacterium sp.]HQA74753.1 DUF4252 domain-containing protein [Flavobacterium sp.]